MRRLREIWLRPIPAEQSLVVFAAVSVILLLTAAVLLAIPGPSTDTSNSNPVAIDAAPVEPDPARQLEMAVEAGARRFLAGYLRLISGQGNPEQIETASPELTRHLTRPMRVPPAARRRHPRVVEIEAGPLSADHVSVTATVKAAGTTYPVILQLALKEGRWLVTRVGAE